VSAADDMRALAERFRALLSSRGDLSAAPDILSDDLYFRGSLRQQAQGLDGFAGYMRAVTAAFDEFRCDVEDLVVEGDTAFAKVRFSGVHIGPLLDFAPTGRRVSYAGAALLKARDGRIVHAWVIGDLDELRENLAGGAVP
jgi:predicted ester cyclase